MKQKMPKNRTQRNNGKNRNNCKNRRFFVDFCNAVTDVNSFAYFVSIVWEKAVMRFSKWLPFLLQIEKKCKMCTLYSNNYHLDCKVFFISYYTLIQNLATNYYSLSKYKKPKLFPFLMNELVMSHRFCKNLITVLLNVKSSNLSFFCCWSFSS